MVYISPDGDCLLWIAGRQGQGQDGRATRKQAEAFNLSELGRQELPLPPALAQCRRCRRGYYCVLEGGDLRLIPLEAPTRATVVE